MKRTAILLTVLFTLVFSALVGQSRGSVAAPAKGRNESPRPRIYRDRIKPHWFAYNTQFWYRNDLAQRTREFIHVSAEQGIRKPAFDHARLAQALTDTTDQAIKANRLPIESLSFDEDDVHVRLQGLEQSWRLNLDTYQVTSVKETDAAKGLPFTHSPRPSQRTGAETSISFVNQLQETVALFWIGQDGQRQAYGTLSPGARRSQHSYAGHMWLVTRSGGEILAVFEAVEGGGLAQIDGSEPAQPRRRRRDRDTPQAQNTPSPDEKWEAFVRNHNLWLRNIESKQETQLSFDGCLGDSYQKDAQRARSMGMQYDRKDAPPSLPDVTWSPDSRYLVALRTQTVAQRTVYMVESAPQDQLQPKLHSYPYLKPGDDIPVGRPQLFSVEKQQYIPISDDLFSTPWSIGRIHWTADASSFMFLYNQRGHQLMRVVSVTAATGVARTVVDEPCATFFDYQGKTLIEYLDETDELIWMSERDGWNHLYLYDTGSGRQKQQITTGKYVIRGVDKIDRDKRQIWFRACGIVPGQDPYYIHHCRVDFDGSKLLVLTAGNGTHTVQWSPDRRFLIDTWSRVDCAPRTELRCADKGTRICPLEEADATEILATGRQFPEPFVAPGRDGATKIYGIIHRPSKLDADRQYPIIESIYAGPHGAHVPKAFRSSYGQQRLADLGFVVVQIDGMGTNWRAKAFHNICWQNLGDAGFPDRILWMTAAAKRYPYMDIRRVGIYGGSAGGQNALRAVLAHGDFYDAAVADCGCHDNRMDKIWWNEQWMGWPVGPHYAEQSNVTQAHCLQGKLLLIVGELDRNVDPASTMQVVKALIKADKDFDMLVIPSAGHGAGGSAYGRRRQQDFFIQHLQGKP
jgi:dipeptidyl-peptidase 4